VLKKNQIGAAVVLLAACATQLIVIREYRRDRAQSRLVYTASVKAGDIVDTTNNAMAALIDACIRAQHYALTGQTIYSEAYDEDVRGWQDESAALVLIGKKDPGNALIQDFSKAGTRTLDELAMVISLYNRGGSRGRTGARSKRFRSGLPR
jgi:hypothetical protein